MDTQVHPSVDDDRSNVIRRVQKNCTITRIHPFRVELFLFASIFFAILILSKDVSLVIGFAPFAFHALKKSPGASQAYIHTSIQAPFGIPIAPKKEKLCSYCSVANDITRRTFLVASAASIVAKPAHAEPPSLSAESLTLPTGLLESRVDENLLVPPPYGMEQIDISYPSWFQGTWDVRSTTVSVQAPCGAALFGSNATFQAALSEVGTELVYASRFVPLNSDTYRADREYNVRGIASSSNLQIIDVPIATPNKLTAILLLPSQGDPVRVDLLTVSRRQEVIDETHFHCAEVVREIIGTRNGQAPLVLKEIETISLYTHNVSNHTITCRQRTATFLMPSQTNPVQYRMWERANGRPVDVRYYNVLYSPKVRTTL